MLTQEFDTGKKIKELRKQKGLTLADITNLTGLSKTTLSDIENNKTKPNLSTIERLSKVIDILPLFLQGQLEINEESYETYKEVDKVEEANSKYSSENEVEENIDSFTIKLVEELLKENIIKDPENIPQEIVDLILVKLKKDIEIRKRSAE